MESSDNPINRVINVCISTVVDQLNGVTSKESLYILHVSVNEFVCHKHFNTLTFPDVSVSSDSICKMLTTKILRSFSLPIMWNIFLEYPTNKKKKKLNHAVWKSLLRMAQQTHHSDLCKALPETSSAQDAERFHFTQIQ